MICRSRKIIFVHIPKNGGSSIEDMLWPEPRSEGDLWKGIVRPGFNKYQSGGLQHLTARLIRQDIGRDMFESCYRFALVRDPVDRLISQFNYLNRGRLAQRLLDLGSERDFDDYLEGISTREHVQWMPQVEFLLDNDGTPLVEMFRLEEIGTGFACLATKLGISERTMLRSNVTLTQNQPSDWITVHRHDLRADQLKRIYHLYQADFEFLGYPTIR